jgi:hypothetical protein
MSSSSPTFLSYPAIKKIIFSIITNVVILIVGDGNNMYSISIQRNNILKGIEKFFSIKKGVQSGLE